MVKLGLELLFELSGSAVLSLASPDADFPTGDSSWGGTLAALEP